MYFKSNGEMIITNLATMYSRSAMCHVSMTHNMAKLRRNHTIGVATFKDDIIESHDNNNIVMNPTRNAICVDKTMMYSCT